MKLLITGGAGFIGSNLVRRMLLAGNEVLNLDAITYAGNLKSLSDVATLPNYNFAHVDIKHSEAVDHAIQMFRPDAILHLAAESHVDRSIDGPQMFIQTNIVGTGNLLQAALKFWRGLDRDSQHRFRFIHVSTDEVYGSLGPTGKFLESTSYDPHSPYSASKAASDHLARAWCDTYGLPVIVTNCSNNYGPYQFPEKLIPVVILKALKGEPIPVYGRGENIRDWLYVEDHCEALEVVLRKGIPGQTYNIGGNNELKNIELVTMLCSILDEQLERSPGSFAKQISFVTDRPGHDLRYAIDASKIKKELGWEPKQDARTGFFKTLHWYLNNKTWWEDILNGTYKLSRMGLAKELGND
jgi:dTDP-glucose 4,6-dehydratase